MKRSFKVIDLIRKENIIYHTNIEHSASMLSKFYCKVSELHNSDSSDEIKTLAESFLEDRTSIENSSESDVWKEFLLSKVSELRESK